MHEYSSVYIEICVIICNTKLLIIIDIITDINYNR